MTVIRKPAPVKAKRPAVKPSGNTGRAPAQSKIERKDHPPDPSDRTKSEPPKRVYVPTERAAPSKINDLRGQLAKRDHQLRALQRSERKLRALLSEIRNLLRENDVASAKTTLEDADLDE